LVLSYCKSTQSYPRIDRGHGERFVIVVMGGTSSGWQFLGHTQDLRPQFFDKRVPSDFALLSASGWLAPLPCSPTLIAEWLAVLWTQTCPLDSEDFFTSRGLLVWRIGESSWVYTQYRVALATQRTLFGGVALVEKLCGWHN